MKSLLSDIWYSNGNSDGNYEGDNISHGFLKMAALLRYNSYTIKITLISFTIQWDSQSATILLWFQNISITPKRSSSIH